MNKNNLLSLDIIRAILNNDENAIKFFYKHYESWMKKVCTSLRYDGNGSVFYFFDDEEYQDLKTQLYFSAKKFRLD